MILCLPGLFRKMAPNTPLILGSDHPLSKQARQNQQWIPQAVPVSRLLIWPVAAPLRWRVALR